jgi:hypothetical protein
VYRHDPGCLSRNPQLVDQYSGSHPLHSRRCRCPDRRNQRVFPRQGVVPHWRLCPGDVPSDLEAQLIQNGLSPGEDQIAMAADLEKLNEDLSVPKGSVIERVTNAAAMSESTDGLGD